MREISFYTTPFDSLPYIKRCVRQEGAMAKTKFDWMADDIVRHAVARHSTPKQFRALYPERIINEINRMLEG